MSQQTVTGERIWLDCLPDDICNRIARYVSAHGLRSSQGFAKVSDTQRGAVLHSLSYKIELFELSWRARSNDHFASACEDVISLLGRDVRDINCLKNWAYDYPQCVKECFRLPSLRAAHLYGVDEAIDDIVHAGNLRSLYLHFGSLTDTAEKLMTALQRLSVLNIRQLLLAPKAFCFRELFGNNEQNYPRLATWFPHVEKLTLFCCSQVPLRHTSANIWRCIEPFQALKDVVLSEEVPEDAIEKLKTIDRVTLSGEAVSQLVDKIPERVVCIYLDGFDEWCFVMSQTRFSVYHTDRVLLRKIAACKGLETLVRCVAPGAEASLVNVMGNLRSLTLFAVGDIDLDDPAEDEVIFGTPYAPVPGAMLDAIKAAPYLKKLLLRNIDLERKELGEILMTLGTRLEEFDECMPGRTDCFRYRPEECRPKLEEQIAVIQAAVRYNPSLRSFRVDMNEKWFPDKESVLSLLPELDETVELLHRRAPSLDEGLMRTIVSAFRDPEDSDTGA